MPRVHVDSTTYPRWGLSQIASVAQLADRRAAQVVVLDVTVGVPPGRLAEADRPHVRVEHPRMALS